MKDDKILIDTNVFYHFFESTKTFNNRYFKLKEKVKNNKAKLFYGGDKYMKELSKATRYYKMGIMYLT